MVMGWDGERGGGERGGGGVEGNRRGVFALSMFSTDGQKQFSFLHFPAVCGVFIRSFPRCEQFAQQVNLTLMQQGCR